MGSVLPIGLRLAGNNFWSINMNTKQNNQLAPMNIMAQIAAVQAAEEASWMAAPRAYANVSTGHTRHNIFGALTVVVTHRMHARRTETYFVMQ